MKRVLGEYGKVLLACLAGVIALLLLLHEGGVADALNHLKPDNPEVKNELVKLQLTALQDRKKPEIQFRYLKIELGDTFQIGDLIKSAMDADGKDLSHDVEYYLEDGKKVDKSYGITAKELTTYEFRFYVEDEQNLYTEKQYAVAVHNKSGVEEADKYIKEWDFSNAPSDKVTAKYYSAVAEDGTIRRILRLEGTGTAKKITASSQRPWNNEVSNITDISIADSVQTPDISYWFYGCKALKRMPKLKGIVNMNHAFQGCTQLLEGDIPEGVINADYAFYGCSAMAASVIDSKELSTMNYAFYNCRKLRGKLLIGSNPRAYTNCFGYVACGTGGISLKVYAENAGCAATVSRMVSEERKYTDRGSQITYKGVAE